MSHTQDSENLSSAEKRHHLCTSEKEQLLAAIKTRLLACDEVTFAYLHGSFLSQRPFRDVDVAVFFAEHLKHDAQTDISLQLTAELSHTLRIPVDIHPLNKTPASFVFQTSSSTLLFSKNEEARLSFLEQCLRA